MRRYAAILALVIAAEACIPTRPAEPPECSDAELVRIEADYVAAILSACKHESYDSCAARPAIDRDFDARRQAWENCQ